jgi:hypothetical protein
MAPGEPTRNVVTLEVRRLFARARRHWFALTVLYLGTIAGVVALTWRRPVVYEATAVVRITEVTDSPTLGRAWTIRELRGRVVEVAFSNERLLEVMQALSLANTKSARFDAAAEIEELRDWFSVEVQQNKVIALLDPDDQARSARVVITYHDEDPKRALEVVRALGGLVTRSGTSERRRELESAIRYLDEAAREAQQVVDDLLAQGERLAGVDPVLAGVEEKRMRTALRETRQRLARVELERHNARMSLASEAENRGVELQLLEPMLGPRPLPRPWRATFAGLATAFFGFPLCGLLVGAFSRTVCTPADVERQGLVFLGRLPVRAFEGAGGAGPRQP